MSKENVKLFFEKVQVDKGLQEKLKNLHSENQEKMQESIVKLGAETGYDFNVEEIQQLTSEMTTSMQQNGELDDAQLEAIAGGGVGGWIVVSIITAGTVCIASAVGSEREDMRCALNSPGF